MRGYSRERPLFLLTLLVSDFNGLPHSVHTFRVYMQADDVYLQTQKELSPSDTRLLCGSCSGQPLG